MDVTFVGLATFNSDGSPMEFASPDSQKGLKTVVSCRHCGRGIVWNRAELEAFQDSSACFVYLCNRCAAEHQKERAAQEIGGVL